MIKHRFPVPLRWLSALTVVVLAAASTFGQAQDQVVLDRMKKDIFFLASPECEGRGVDTKGIDIAAEYIVGNLKAAGLKPGGVNGTWFQPFTIAAGGKGGGAAGGGTGTLTLKGPLGQTVELQADKDYQLLPGVGAGKVDAQFVFVGYGLTMPADKKGETKDKAKLVSQPPQKKGGPGKGKDPAPAQPSGEVTWVGYDDFKGVDVKGKIVVVLRRTPRWDNKATPFGGDQEAYASLEKKIANCEAHGAAAVILVNDRSYGADGDKFSTTGAPKAGIPVFQLKRGVLDMMLVSGKGNWLVDLERDIDRDLKPRSGPISGWSGALTSSAAANAKQTGIACKNIIGVLEGAGPLANETVVVGAHYDHLGYGQGKGAKGGGMGAGIYPGADDNGSGSTTIMELARRFGAIKNRQGRRIVFIWFSAEERGLLGSKAYCANPIFPLDKTVACMNLDMVGRLKQGEKPEIYAEGFNSGTGLEDLLKKLNTEFNFTLKGPHPQQIYGRSDQASFYAKGVPGMFFFTDFHNDYHKQGDTPDKINVAGMAKVASLAEKIVAHLAETQDPPKYIAGAVKGKGGANKGGGKKAAGKMGITIDPNDNSNKGALVTAVAEKGAGAKGGIMVDDRILTIGGTPTPGATAYQALLLKLTPGTAVEVVVLRKGAELKLKVTPD
ncbi:MAG TPA: M28 family peptidase [Gemmataceae bacterium]|nr:M28 family peptidase [Gemmataceae bacterium]